MSDYIYVALKVGDKICSPYKEHIALKDGDPICYIDEDKWGRHIYDIVSENSLRVFAWIKLPKSEKENIQAALLSVGDPSDVVNYRARSKRIPLDVLEAATKINGLVSDLRSSTKIVPILDCTKIPLTDLLRDATTIDNSQTVVDINAITSGSYTVGSGGDYATWALALADLANLTGDLTLTQTSSTIETAGITITENLAGFTLTLTSLAHNGNPTSGYTISIDHDSSNFNFQQEGPGTTNVYNLYFKRTTAGAAATRNMLAFGSVIAQFTANVYNVLFDGNNLTGSGYYNYDNTPVIKMSNVNIWGCSGGGYGFFTSDAGLPAATNVYENVTAYACSYGFALESVADAGTFRNCAAISCTTAGFTNIGASDGYNNASSDLTAANANWATGSGNITGASADDFVSVDDTNADFLQVQSTSGSLRNGGIQPTNTHAAIDIRGRTRVAPWEIGSSRRTYVPVISSITASGEAITISGTNFEPATTDATVTEDGAAWAPATATDTEITGIATKTGTITYAVTNSDGESDSDSVTIASGVPVFFFFDN